jgi:hypothetical protein
MQNSNCSLLQETSMKQDSVCCLLHASFLHGLFFGSEDAGDVPRNVGWRSLDYVALDPRRENSKIMLFVLNTAIKQLNVIELPVSV